jgi:ABC-type transport system involved in multi-copper enzyme maturation permease subunit
MIALVKKELREHYPVALLAFVVAWVAVAAAIATLTLLNVDAQYRYSGFYPGVLLRLGVVPLVNPVFLGVFTCTCGVLGTLLGALLTAREEVFHTWSFLLSRPVSRLQVFWAKLVTGTLLYATVLAPPYLALGLWSAVPGNVPAPWHWSFMRGGALGLFLGYALLLGTFACGIRPARWYGTRLVPLVATITAIALLADLWTPLVCAALYLLLCAIVVLASAGSFLPRFRLGRAALAVILSLGCYPIIMGAEGIVQFVGSVLMDLDRQDQVADEWDSFQFAADGEPQKVTDRHLPGTFASTRIIRRLDGTLIAEGQAVNEYVFMASIWMHDSWSGLCRTSRRAPGIEVVAEDRREITYLCRPVNYLVTYDLSTRLPRWFAGKNGCAATAGEVTPFGDGVTVERGRVKNDSVIILHDGDGLYAFNRSARSVTPVMQGSVGRLSIQPDKISEDEWVWYALGNDCIWAARNGKGFLRFPLPEELRRHDNLEVRLVAGDLLGVIARSRRTGTDDLTVFLCKLDTAGRIQWQATEVVRWPSPSSYLVALDGALRWAKTAAQALSPLWSSAAAVVPQLDAQAAMSPREWTATLYRHGFWPWTISNAIVAGGLGVLVLLLLRRRGLKGKAAALWVCFAALTGIPGLLTIWALLLTERRIPCPACGGKRPPSQPACPRCGAEWPAPERRDVDIPAPASA